MDRSGERRRALCAIALVVTLSGAADAGERDPNRLIAQIGERRIVLGDIGCNPKVLEFNRHRLGGRSVESACAEAEQQEFLRLATSALIEAACAVEKCTLSESEIASFRSPIVKDEQTLRRYAAHARRVPEAVRRVYRGERIEDVYETSVKALHIPLESFRNEVAMYGSLERVERFLAQDFVETLRRQFEERARHEAMLAQLRTKIDALAAVTARPADAAADDYLRALRQRITLRVLDERFRIPMGRDVFARTVRTGTR